ncbi:hypothetical protein NMG60_11013270 [Bertholletia excelsa]
MANTLCFTPLASVKPPKRPGVLVGNSAPGKVLWINDRTQNCKHAKFQSFEAKNFGIVFQLGLNHFRVLNMDMLIVSAALRIRRDATEPFAIAYLGEKILIYLIKFLIIVCADCDGNGMKVCSQCKGSGVNSEDHFNGRYKAGELCWLCRGKREILCGNCNGAGFIGGFMSTFDD